MCVASSLLRHKNDDARAARLLLLLLQTRPYPPTLPTHPAHRHRHRHAHPTPRQTPPPPKKGTIVIILVLWSLVTIPLTVLGGIAGKNAGAEFDAPTRTNKYPREV